LFHVSDGKSSKRRIFCKANKILEKCKMIYVRFNTHWLGWN
jgi:hypothetical protein